MAARRVVLVMLGFAGYGPQVRERARTEGRVWI
jgi:hypothetical protein